MRSAPRLLRVASDALAHHHAAPEVRGQLGLQAASRSPRSSGEPWPIVMLSPNAM